MRFWLATRSLVPINVWETRESRKGLEIFERLRITLTATEKCQNSSKEFLEIENEQIIAVQTILIDKTNVKLLFKSQVNRKT